MSITRLLAVGGLLFLSGCLYQAGRPADETVCDLAGRPYDLLPTQIEAKPLTSTSASTPAKKADLPGGPATDVQTVAYMEGQANIGQQPPSKPKLEPKIPPEIPGSEAKPIKLPEFKDKEARQRAIKQLFPELPPLAKEPTPLPGPEGRPYTLADLHQMAAINSPELRQAANAVNAAQGNLIQAKAYPNPTVGWNVQPSNDGSTAGVQGPFIDQAIKFAGKIKLTSAAAEMDLRNAELALRRARSDLATRVRNAYYAVLVAQETVRINKALARFTDEMYRLQTGLLEVGPTASYEPLALRAQAYAARLAYEQAIQTYVSSWRQLVAAVGQRQLPLTEVAGHIDAFIPFFDYDTVRSYALRNHTDVLIARNGLEKAQYTLKSAQIAPYPDVDINVSFLKEYALAPKQFVHTATIGFPLPIWDQNKGNIMAAESALLSATEEPHRVEQSLTTTLAGAYMGYKTNLKALEYYRLYILPDQVRAYRGVLDRRQVDPAAAFADLLAAQQTLASGVTTYLGILGTLWTSVVSVADIMQTDDLFQVGEARPVPPLPDLDKLLAWPCCHDCPPAAAHSPGKCVGVPVVPASGPGLPKPVGEGKALKAPRPLDGADQETEFASYGQGSDPAATKSAQATEIRRWKSERRKPRAELSPQISDP
jgi:cobalt-zinc-cadmium efflux system outer membrane protein